MPKQYSTRDLCSLLNVTDGRIRQLRAELSIGRKIGNSYVFSERDLKRLQARQTKPGPAGRKDA